MPRDIDYAAGPKKRIKRRLRPDCILGKKILRGRRLNCSCPILYLLRWKQDENLPLNEQGEKWIGVQRLKYFLEMIERYEIANYDGPQIYDPGLLKKQVDFDLERKFNTEQISCDQKTLNKIYQKNRVKTERFIHIPPEQSDKKKQALVNVQLGQRYRLKPVQKQLLQGSYQDNDRAESILNFIKIPQTGFYNFLVTWKTRIDGFRPNPSWVEEDQLKIIQPDLLKSISKDKNLNIVFDN